MTSARAYFYFLAAIASLALAVAYISELFFSVYPCQLCFYQRYIYFTVLFVSVIALFIDFISTRYKLILSSLVLLIGLAISFFHSGVERKLFVYESACTGFIGHIESFAQLVATIENTTVVPASCDVLGPQILGFTMANLNVIMLLCLLYLNIMLLFNASFIKKCEKKLKKLLG